MPPMASQTAKPARVGPLSGMAGDRHDAAHRLDLAVVGGRGALGAVLAEARHGAIDEPRIDPRQRLVADARACPSRRGGSSPSPRRPWRRAAARSRSTSGLVRSSARLRLLELMRHPAGAEVARGPLLVGRAAAHVVAARPLDLDDVGAEQRQLVAAERAREHLREIEDADAGEGLGHAALAFALSRCSASLLAQARWRPASACRTRRGGARSPRATSARRSGSRASSRGSRSRQAATARWCARPAPSPARCSASSSVKACESASFGRPAGIAEREVGEQQPRHADVFDDVLGAAHHHGGDAGRLQRARGEADALVADGAVGQRGSPHRRRRPCSGRRSPGSRPPA